MAPAEIVKTIWERDPDPDSGRWTKHGRQFAVMNAKGEHAAYTGPKASTWAGDKQGKFVTAQGNILAGEAVVADMVTAFEQSQADEKGQRYSLAMRLVMALEAGQAAGGDRRCQQSAALIVVKKNGGVWLNNDVVLRLQVDDNPEPIKELRRLVEKSPRRGRGRQ
jgi:uncharacterized Ntn-hydrolase superfamily protein